MFEKIFEVIEGVPTVEIAQPLLTAAGFQTAALSSNSLRVNYEDTSCSIIQLWGNKVILRGIDSEGDPREIVTHRGV